MSTVVNNARIKGNTLALSVNGKDYWSDIAEYSLEPAESDKDVVTFADAQGGTAASWSLKGKAIQSTAAASFWKFIWDNVGKVVNFILAPHGNATATAEQPHFTGQVRISSKPPIGTSAGEDKGATFDFEWATEGEPELKTSGSTIAASHAG